MLYGVSFGESDSIEEKVKRRKSSGWTFSFFMEKIWRGWGMSPEGLLEGIVGGCVKSV